MQFTESSRRRLYTLRFLAFSSRAHTNCDMISIFRPPANSFSATDLDETRKTLDIRDDDRIFCWPGLHAFSDQSLHTVRYRHNVYRIIIIIVWPSFSPSSPLQSLRHIPAHAWRCETIQIQRCVGRQVHNQRVWLSICGFEQIQPMGWMKRTMEILLLCDGFYPEASRRRWSVVNDRWKCCRKRKKSHYSPMDFARLFELVYLSPISVCSADNEYCSKEKRKISCKQMRLYRGFAANICRTKSRREVY